MEKIVLFSQPGGDNFQEILDNIFPTELPRKVLAYMPSEGGNSPQKYADYWKEIADKYEAEFKVIDNSKKDAAEERDKLLASNILLITGGNTFQLLKNLRESGLDSAIKEFARKANRVIAGFSAGALVLTPTIEACNLPPFDDNLVGITDLSGLSIINFEVFPHFNETRDRDTLEKYKAQTPHEVKEITNEGYISLDI